VDINNNGEYRTFELDMKPRLNKIHPALQHLY